MTVWEGLLRRKPTLTAPFTQPPRPSTPGTTYSTPTPIPRVISLPTATTSSDACSLTHPDGTIKQWNYNDAGNQGTQYQVTANDEKNHPTDYYHAWLNHLVTVTEHISSQHYNTAYQYDTVGNLVQVADSKNQITTYSYDSLNRLVSINFPDTTTETRAYDNVGNLVSRTMQPLPAASESRRCRQAQTTTISCLASRFNSNFQ